MKRDNVNYLVVGSVVLVTITSLLYALFRLTGGVDENDPYYVIYPNVGGLKAGTPVTYEGFKVGAVTEILPSREAGGMRYRVNLLIRDGWSVPADSTARIYSEGLLSETVINIDEGDSAEFLKLGSRLQGVQNENLFSTVNTVANDVSILLRDTVRPLLDNLNTSISTLGDHVDARLPLIMIGIQELVETLQSSANKLPELLGDGNAHKIDTILTNTEQLSANLLVLSKGLLKTQKNADTLITETNGIIKDNHQDINSAISALRQSFEDLSLHTDDILQNLDGTTHNLNEFSRKIRHNPGLLLSSKPPVEVGVVNE